MADNEVTTLALPQWSTPTVTEIHMAAATLPGGSDMRARAGRGRAEFHWIEKPETPHAGRPSSAPLVRDEATQRIARNDAPGSLKEFGNALSDWLAKTHPDAPQMKPEVVEKCVRDLWRQSNGRK
jgi:hypothetical protein